MKLRKKIWKVLDREKGGWIMVAILSFGGKEENFCVYWCNFIGAGVGGVEKTKRGHVSHVWTPCGKRTRPTSTVFNIVAFYRVLFKTHAKKFLFLPSCSCYEKLLKVIVIPCLILLLINYSSLLGLFSLLHHNCAFNFIPSFLMVFVSSLWS